MTEFDKQVAHLSALATTPGWWQYARQRAQELDAQPGFAGLYAAVQAAVRTAGYMPPKVEQGEWWLR